MAQITAALVKDLRDRTGAGMMDAKKALVETDGDMEAASDWLRAKGLSKAAKKSGRTAADGLVAAVLSDDGKTGALVELNVETDFVARNEKFQSALSGIAKTALESDGTLEGVQNAKEIAKIPGVDGLFAASGDLGNFSGFRAGQPQYEMLIAEVVEAAQEAGKSFADGLTPGINLGLVAFAGTASVLVSPTTNREATKAAIDKLQLSERTATGEAIFTSLQSIDTLGAVLGGGEAAPPARIVLLSDGKQTVPEEPDDPRGAYTAARAAAERDVPISTISFGTSYGTVDIETEAGSDRVPVPVDDPSLREIADLSGGSFFTASSLEELRAVYDTLEEQIGFEITRGDASRPWLILGVLFTAAGLGTALVLRQRLP